MVIVIIIVIYYKKNARLATFKSSFQPGRLSVLAGLESHQAVECFLV